MANDSGPPELVLFDLGGVLCRFEPDRRAAELAAAIGVTEDEIHALVFASGFDQECDLGIHSETAILERFRRLGFPGDRDELRRAWAKAFIPDRAVIDLAIALLSEGVVVATLSDNGPVLLAAIESVVTPSAIDEHVSPACSELPNPNLRPSWLRWNCSMRVHSRPSSSMTTR
ncbi:hypothetical protein [Rhodococcus qingshengii]|uniref:hypothetical protein n=1 Tax=Rhodococcus qingshengii TaxID=334542 RepID=UPI001F40F9A9|nr:hypothetical protein [Rhodococcus qingshengii]